MLFYPGVSDLGLAEIVIVAGCAEATGPAALHYWHCVEVMVYLQNEEQLASKMGFLK